MMMRKHQGIKWKSSGSRLEERDWRKQNLDLVSKVKIGISSPSDLACLSPCSVCFIIDTCSPKNGRSCVSHRNAGKTEENASTSDYSGISASPSRRAVDQSYRLTVFYWISHWELDRLPRTTEFHRFYSCQTNLCDFIWRPSLQFCVPNIILRFPNNTAQIAIK